VRYKDPSAVLDWEFDWSAWLQAGETISAFTITVTGANQDSTAASATAVTVWLSGGTAATAATIACRITTTAGRTDERTITVSIKDR
jgi:hypothetical protein